MIVELFLIPIMILVRNLLSVLPVISVDNGFVSAFSSFFGLINTAGYFLPLRTISIILSLFLAFYGLQLAISVLNWVIAKIPTIN